MNGGGTAHHLVGHPLPKRMDGIKRKIYLRSYPLYPATLLFWKQKLAVAAFWESGGASQPFLLKECVDSLYCCVVPL